MNARDRGVSIETPAPGADEGPLRRWARRKRAVAREKEAADEARRRDASRGLSEAEHDGGGSAGDASEAILVEEKVLTDEDMPSLDSLDQHSDYSGFLSSGVSEGLRRRALRKLFSSAVFNVPDGLDDYDDDFTSFAALGDIVTSDMKHQAEMEAERAKQARARAQPATGLEDESRGAEEVEEVVGAEDERLADADDDATDLPTAGPPDRPEASEPWVPGDADPMEPVETRDATERAGLTTLARPEVELPSEPDDESIGAGHERAAHADEEAMDPPPEGGESAASSKHREYGSHAPANSGVRTKAGETDPRGA